MPPCLRFFHFLLPLAVFLVLCLKRTALAGDPYVFFDWTVSYISASPLGVKQKVSSLLFLLQFSDCFPGALELIILIMLCINLVIILFQFDSLSQTSQLVTIVVYIYNLCGNRLILCIWLTGLVLLY